MKAIIQNILDKIEPYFSRNGKLSKYYPIYEAADTFLFSPSDKTQSGPHIRDAIDIKRVMFFVIIASVIVYPAWCTKFVIKIFLFSLSKFV